MKTFEQILKRKQKYYGKTEASYEFAAEEFAKEYHKEQLRLYLVRFELPGDDIFDKQEVNLRTPLDEFYYYERPAYLEDDQKQFRERLQKALDYLKGN